MESKLKDFVSTLQKQKKPKIITVADEMKRINRNEREIIYYANKRKLS